MGPVDVGAEAVDVVVVHAGADDVQWTLADLDGDRDGAVGVEAFAGDDADAVEDAEFAEPALGASGDVRGIEVAGIDAGAALDQERLHPVGADDLDPAEIGRRTGHDVERHVEDAVGMVGDDVVLVGHGEGVAELPPAIGDCRLRGDDRIGVGKIARDEADLLQRHPRRQRSRIQGAEVERLARGDLDPHRHRPGGHIVERAERGERAAVDGDGNLARIKRLAVERGGEPGHVGAGAGEEADKAGGRLAAKRVEVRGAAERPLLAPGAPVEDHLDGVGQGVGHRLLFATAEGPDAERRRGRTGTDDERQRQYHQGAARTDSAQRDKSPFERGLRAAVPVLVSPLAGAPLWATHAEGTVYP